MRLLVACKTCRRQYDASGREIGSTFHCHCGEMVEVRQPRGHDAAVVRCSSCGGPRGKGVLACGFCGSDFTIHEQDRDTVCPGCLATVSDRARFCDHCGQSIEPELVAGEATNLACPACDPEQHLISRLLAAEKVTILECSSCAGMWLGSDGFRRLIDRAVAVSLPEGHLPKPAKAAGDTAQTSGWRYRHCPICRKLMPRQHYGRRSGVIVDLCRDHGVWFDAEELARILAWVRSGDQTRARKELAVEARVEERNKEIRLAGEARAAGLSGDRRPQDSIFLTIFEGLSWWW